LEDLYLGDTEMTGLPAEIGRIKTLKNLSLVRNPHLTSLPKSIKDLPNLESLYLDRDQVEKLEPWVAELPARRKTE